MNKSRRWAVKKVDSPEELAKLLTEMVWTPCTGFQLGNYLFLNDSFSPDGAQEYGIIDLKTGLQVESITFSWCSVEKARKYIEDVLAGKYAEGWRPGIDMTQIEAPEEHGTCWNCA